MSTERQNDASFQGFIHSTWDQRLPWREQLTLSSRENGVAGRIGDAAEIAALHGSTPCTRSYLCRIPKEAPGFHTELISWGSPRLLNEEILPAPPRSPPWTIDVLEWPDGVLIIAPIFNKGDDKASSYSFTIVGREQWARALHSLVSTLTNPIEPKLEANIYVLGQSPYNNNKLSLRELPPVGAALVRENYVNEVLEALDHIITDLSSPGPCGRLSILRGPPGTGKTFALRGILWALHKIPSTKCVLIPSSTIQSLAEPGIIDVFLDSSSRDDDPSIPPRHILLIEDADEALVSRGSDNLSTLSALLNITDGLLGQALDIRVIATTNAAKTDIDPAVTRAGRLCSNTYLRPLFFSEAVVIAERLGRPPLDEAKEAWTLAEIYSWKGSTQRPGKAKLGFRPGKEST